MHSAGVCQGPLWAQLAAGKPSSSELTVMKGHWEWPPKMVRLH